MNASNITLAGVSYVYGAKTPYEKRALDGIDLAIEGGVVTGIIGHTGSGKSTLVQLLNGLLSPTEGTVSIGGQNIWEDPKKIAAWRFRVGLVMQYPEYQLFDETVEKDIAFGPRNMGLSEEEIRERVLYAAQFANLDETLLAKSPFDLSGGQKRRAALAGVLAMKPEILVLDEPAAGLDPQGRTEILSRIRYYQKESGTTVIIVSHSMEDMAMYCDRIVVMEHGRVLMHGTCPEVFSRSEELISVGLDVPLVTRVAAELSRRGIDIGQDIYTVKYAAQKLAPLLGLGANDEF